ncbi:MAG: molybdopterin-dependent oxidoreductase [Actinomycetota bacterium]|nr:molybdopterin-dependent oxidoreductase [Actinomycetota bacterium]
MASTVTGSCHHDCPDSCVWNVTVDEGRAVSLKGDPDHPTTRGQLCPKVNRLLDRVYHRERVLQPLLRVGPKGAGRFEPSSWDRALDLVAERIDRIRNDGRTERLLPYSFDGTQGVIQKGIVADRFFSLLGTSDVHRHLCGVTAWLGAASVSGQPFGIDPFELSRSRTIVLWGTNTYHTNRHLWPVIEEARTRGASVVVVDPVRTPTAARADQFFQVRPGSDVALVLGLVQVLHRDDLLDAQWITEHTTGWSELLASAVALPLDRIAVETGIAVERIEWLARRFATERPAAVRSLIGAEHRANGHEIMRALAILPALTGAWRDPGGGLARSTQIYFETALDYPAALPGDEGRRRFNMAALGQVLTDPTLDPPIDLLFVHNSNPAVICPDQNQVIAGLEREDLFTVVVEQFLTDTARYADVILPATSQIEHLDLGIAWGHLYLSLNQPAIAPVGEARPNSEIFRLLARRLGLTDPLLARSDEELIRGLLASNHPWLDGITLESLAANRWERLRVPPGFRPNVDAPTATADGRLHLGALTHRPPEPTAVTTPDQGPGPLLLISRKQHLRFLNANYGGDPEHLPVPAEPRLELHPVDAAERGVADGTRVTVHNDRGTLTVAAVLSTDLQPGLASLPFGWWNHHTEQRRSVNALTNPTVPPDGRGSAAFHDTWVTVSRA